MFTVVVSMLLLVALLVSVSGIFIHTVVAKFTLKVNGNPIYLIVLPKSKIQKENPFRFFYEGFPTAYSMQN